MKEKFNLIIDDQNVGNRLDLAIVNLIKKINRSTLKNYSSNLLVNGKKVKFSYKCKLNDKVEFEIDQVEDNGNIIPQEIPIEILYEDTNYIIINKQQNMVVHPAKGNFTGTVINALVGMKKKLSESNNKYRIGVVHRLDKETSGIMIFAKNRDSLEYLTELFKTRNIIKKYHAIVKGLFPINKKIIENNIGRNPKNRKKMSVLKNGGKKSITIIEDIKHFSNYSYLDIKLMTGRTHQIRVHLSNLGYPIIGDSIYARKDDNFYSVPLCLVSYRLAFYDKFTNKNFNYIIDDPKHIREVFLKLNCNK